MCTEHCDVQRQASGSEEHGRGLCEAQIGAGTLHVTEGIPLSAVHRVRQEEHEGERAGRLLATASSARGQGEGTGRRRDTFRMRSKCRMRGLMPSSIHDLAEHGGCTSKEPSTGMKEKKLPTEPNQVSLRHIVWCVTGRKRVVVCGQERNRGSNGPHHPSCNGPHHPSCNGPH